MQNNATKCLAFFIREEEEEEEEVQPMQRSGMVRAFSHLPQAVRGEPAWPRAAAPAPAPASRPAWADAPEAPAGHEADDGHDPEPDDDADEGHGSSASAETGAHEPDDGRPWYQPRITAADLQPEGGGHDDPAKDNIGPMPRLSGGAGSFSHPPVHGEDDAVNEHADAGSHVDFEPPATAGSDTHGTLGPVSPRGAAPPTGRSLFLTPRPMPPEYARQMAATSGATPARPRSLADIPGGTFQQVAAKAGAQQQQGARLAQSSPPARPANATPSPPQTPAQGSGFISGSSALEPANRIHRLDEIDPGRPPRQRIEGTVLKNKPREQFEKEKAAHQKAKSAYDANHAANNLNQQTLKAWENYDRATQMMENAPEGRKVLDHLRNDKNRVFKVVMVNDPVKDSYMGVRIKPGRRGQYVNTGMKDEQGRDIHVIFLSTSSLARDAVTPGGKINPDAEALEDVWHELYHASERKAGDAVDPLELGTPRRADRVSQQHSAHERRAVRFENIIRARNGGTRIKNKHGGTYVRGPDGQSRMVGEIDVPDAQPPWFPAPKQ